MMVVESEGELRKTDRKAPVLIRIRREWSVHISMDASHLDPRIKWGT